MLLCCEALRGMPLCSSPPALPMCAVEGRRMPVYKAQGGGRRGRTMCGLCGTSSGREALHIAYPVCVHGSCL